MNNIRILRSASRLAGVAAAAAFAFGLVNPVSHADGATGSITGTSAGQAITVDGNSEWAGIINLTADGGGVVPVYCIDLYTGTTVGVQYAEGTWSDANVSNLAAVTAVLRHGYPNETPTNLAVEAGLTDATASQAAAATQAAIWHFSDGVNLDPTNDPVIVAIYDMLVATAGSASEPSPTLTISPDTANGTIGGLIGPFTVHTNAATVNLSVADAQIVNAAGEPITTAVDGDDFYVKAGTIGEFVISADATVTVRSGRVFLTTNPSPKQKLITAASSQVSASASVTATAEPIPTTTEAPTTTGAPDNTDSPATTGAPDNTDAPTTTAGSVDEPAASTSTTIVAVDEPVVPTTIAPADSGAHAGAALPTTGSDTGSLLWIAAVLVLAGVSISTVAVRRRS